MPARVPENAALGPRACDPVHTAQAPPAGRGSKTTFVIFPAIHPGDKTAASWLKEAFFKNAIVKKKCCREAHWMFQLHKNDQTPLHFGNFHFSSLLTHDFVPCLFQGQQMDLRLWFLMAVHSKIHLDKAGRRNWMLCMNQSGVIMQWSFSANQTAMPKTHGLSLWVQACFLETHNSVSGWGLQMWLTAVLSYKAQSNHWKV